MHGQQVSGRKTMIKLKQAMNILVLITLIFICGFVSSNESGGGELKIRDRIMSYPLNNNGQAGYLAPVYNSLKDKQYNDAINQIETLKSAYPNDEDLYYLQGIACFGKYELLTALRSFERTITMNNNRGDAFYYKALMLKKLDKQDLALDAINAAFNKNAAVQLKNQEQLRFGGEWTVEGRRATLFFLRAVIHKSLRHLDNALNDVNTAISISPYQSSSHFKVRGEISFLKKEYDLALKDFEKATGLNPQEGLTWSLMGIINLYNGNYDKAIIQFNKAVEINRDIYNFALANSAIAYWLKGNKNLALEAMGGAIGKKPAAQMYYHLAYFHHLMGNKIQARLNFQKAEQFKSNILEIRSLSLKQPPKNSPTYTFYQQEYQVAKKYLGAGETVTITSKNRTPTLKITSLKLEPNPVPVNTAFDIKIKFKPDIPHLGNKRIPTLFYFKIYKNNKRLFTSKDISFDVFNGKIKSWKQHMDPVSRAGVYEIKVFVKHKEIIDKKSIKLKIK
jgi:tetratricopeptide (TPR) repeat protein